MVRLAASFLATGLTTALVTTFGMVALAPGEGAVFVFTTGLATAFSDGFNDVFGFDCLDFFSVSFTQNLLWKQPSSKQGDFPWYGLPMDLTGYSGRRAIVAADHGAGSLMI